MKLLNLGARFSDAGSSKVRESLEIGSGGKLVKDWRGVKISMNEDDSRCS
jgi:hypothetical protein